MAFENYTIAQFMDAMFKNDRSVISEEELAIVYEEYIDVAEIYEKEKFENSKYVNFIANRINSVHLSIKLQKEFLEEFGVPFEKELVFFRKFGYIVRWTNKEAFLKKLEEIENKEKKYISQLEGRIKEMIEKDIKREKGEITIKQSRGSFIKTINSLNKVGYKIDKNSDTVEDLAYMIKQETEDSKNK